MKTVKLNNDTGYAIHEQNKGIRFYKDYFINDRPVIHRFHLTAGELLSIVDEIGIETLKKEVETLSDKDELPW